MLAQDAKLDINALVGAVKAATLAQDAKRIAAAVSASAKFAADKAKDEDVENVVKAAAEDEDEEEDEESRKDFADPKNKKYPLATEKEIRAAWDYIHVKKDGDEYSPEERKAIEAKIVAAWKDKIDESGPPADKPGAKDENENDDDDEEKDTKAMDAAIKVAKAEAESAAIKRMQAIAQAEKDVQPILGEIAAMDSAEAIYKLALDQAGVDTDGVHPSAYRALVKMHIKASSAKPAMAQDAAASTGFWKDLGIKTLPARS
jgi:hypothetical protein